MIEVAGIETELCQNSDFLMLNAQVSSPHKPAGYLHSFRSSPARLCEQDLAQPSFSKGAHDSACQRSSKAACYAADTGEARRADVSEGRPADDSDLRRVPSALEAMGASPVLAMSRRLLSRCSSHATPQQTPGGGNQVGAC